MLSNHIKFIATVLHGTGPYQSCTYTHTHIESMAQRLSTAE